jgi:hypothetical protein
MARFMLLSRIQTKDVDEASGMAASAKNPGVVWINNDSGDGPFLYAIEAKTGRLRAYFKLSGVRARDWEALRLTPDGNFLIGDFGDNDAERRDCYLYRTPEPILPPGFGAKLRAGRVEKIPQAYPGGPRNAEALLIHPKTGQFFIVTKSESGTSEVFAGPKLTKITTVSVGGEVTDGAISPDGRELVLLTYEKLLFWRWPENKPLASVLKTRPSALPLPRELKQAEALCYAPDGKTLYLTTEGEFPPLFALRR